MNQLAFRELDAALRLRFDIFLMMVHYTLNPGVPYRGGWHVSAMVHYAEAVMRGDTRRLIVNVPPRYFKSLIFNVALTAFMLGHNPRLRAWAISYGERLAEDLAVQFRKIIESDWYRRIFPNMRIMRTINHDFFTTEGGFRRWTSIGGALTGMGGDIFIVDDAIKPEDVHSEPKREAVNHWFGGTLLSRLNNKEKGQILVLMQRLHQDDLTGYLLRETTGWSHLELPAIAIVPQDIPIGRGRIHHRKVGAVLNPKHETRAALDILRDSMGPVQFSAQYQQRPVPVEGALIDPDWFRHYDTLPEHNPRSYVIQSWDTASKDGLANSYNVCTTWLVHEQCYFLLDVCRLKLNFPALCDMAIALSTLHQPRYILIEDASTGPALADILKKSKAIGFIKLVKPDKDKQVRLVIHQGKFTSGRVWFPKDAPWLRVFLDELLSFPDGKYSDQVDSLSQTLDFKGHYDPGAIARALSGFTDSYWTRYAMAQRSRF